MKWQIGLICALALIIDNSLVAGDKCTIKCFYFPKSQVKTLKCQPIETALPNGATEVNCAVNPLNGKLIFIIGSREKIDRIEPKNWALSPPETMQVDHLEFDFIIPEIDSHTVSKVFPNLRSLVIYKADNVTIDAFMNLKHLQEMRFGRKKNVLVGKTLLFTQHYQRRGLTLQYNTKCFRCQSKDLPKTSFFVDFLSVNLEETVESIRFNECPIDDSRPECQMKFNLDSEIAMPASKEEKHVEYSTISITESRNYKSLIFLIVIGIWTFVLSVSVVIIIILLFMRIAKSQPSLVDRFAQEPLFIGSKNPEQNDL